MFRNIFKFLKNYLREIFSMLLFNFLLKIGIWGRQ